MAFVKANHGRLTVSFKYKRKWFPEYLGLADNRDNRREAEKLVREIESEIRAGTFDYARRFPNSRRLAQLGLNSRPEQTLAEFAASWLEERRSHLTPATHNHYRILLKNHVLPFSRC
jgi:integrase